MPSPNPRIQVCFEPTLYAKIKTLAKGRNQSPSYTVQELVSEILQTEEIAAEYKHSAEKYGEVPVKEDKRKRPRARPWSVSYEEVMKEDKEESDQLPVKALHELVMAKREGRMTKDQKEKTAAATKQSRAEKKEMLKEVLRELLEE